MNKVNIRFVVVMFLFTIHNNRCVSQEKIPYTISLKLPGFFNAYHRDIGVCFTFPVYNHLVVEAGISYIFPTNYNNQAGPQSKIGRFGIKGMLFHLEPKYNISPKDTASFIGLRMSYNIYSYTSQRLISTDKDEIVKYGVQVNAFHLGLVYSVRSLHLKSRVTAEPSFGLGMRIFKVNNDAPLPISSYSLLYRLTKYVIPEERGSYIRPNILCGMRLGYNFKLL